MFQLLWYIIVGLIGFDFGCGCPLSGKESMNAPRRCKAIVL